MVGGQPIQLPLGIKLRDEATFANYFHGPNQAVVAAVRDFADLQSEPQDTCLLLWGADGSGRSHLLQAACHAVAEVDGLAMYLPLDELAQEPPALLDGMESVFHLYNRLREQGGRLLIAASGAPRALGLCLPDLASRLSWGLVFQLQALDDQGKQEVLKLRAAQRGLQLNDEVARYILSRGARGMVELFAALERLDQASLQAQHRLTIPFVKREMGW